MAINKKEIYDEYVSKIEKALNEDNFDSLDYILEFLTTNLDEETTEAIWDLIYEVTLYLEYKMPEYKDEALTIIEEDFGDIK